ncbi:hypothetical protein PG985_005867 [Apiospora marii]|uniref:uncharacterized protein n=1 Tax=Apiospora marii TaxID=335849 RepID=UPI00312FE010
MESIHNASWAAPFPSCSSIADFSGLDLPDIFNEQAWAKTNQYAARFIPSAALANHYTLPEGTIHPVFLSDGGLLFNPQCGQDQHDMVLWPQYVHPADAHKSTTQPLPRMSYDTCSSSRQTTILTSAEDRTIQLSGPQPLPTIGRSCQPRRRAQPKRTPVSVLSSTDPLSTPNNHRLCSAPREVLQAENLRWQAQDEAHEYGTPNQDCTQLQPSFRTSFTLRTHKMEERLMRRRKRAAKVPADVLLKRALDGLQALEKQLQCTTQAQKRLVQATLCQWKQAGRL